MSDQEPVSELTPRPRRHDREAYERTASLYAELVHSPVRTLRENDLVVNQLPNVAEGTEMNLWFAVGHSIFIGDDQQYAADAMGIGLSGVIQKKMVVSPMRSRDLASGSGSGERHQATHTVDAGSLTADLWVTEQQTGCSVLILDWGRGQYSMVHLQPYDDEQFGGWGRSLMALGHYTCGLTSKTFFRSAYGNAWLKHDASTVAANTGGTPKNYILVQTMFDKVRERESQLIGVRNGNRFRFFQQKVIGRQTQVTELRWSGWWSYLPSFTTRSY